MEKEKRRESISPRKEWSKTCRSKSKFEDQKEYESDEFNIISSKLIRLEPEPTTYEEDINGIEEKVNISEKETNRIRNTYLVDLNKHPQSFNELQNFIEESRAKIVQSKESIQDEFIPLKNEKKYVKQLESNHESNSLSVQKLPDSLKNRSNIISRQEELKASINEFTKECSSDLNKANNRKEKLSNELTECQIKKARLSSIKEQCKDFLSNKKEVEDLIEKTETANKDLKSEIEKVESQYKDTERIKEEIKNKNNEIFKEELKSSQLIQDKVKLISESIGKITKARGDIKDACK